jgi:hypothetical protein
VTVRRIKSTAQTLILPEEIEEELVQHVLKFEENLFGLSFTEVRKLAFEIAEETN